MQHLAFLGLGVMGAPMVANLRQKGFTVKAWNRSPRANLAHLNPVATLAAAVEGAEIIFTCLGDIPDVEEVILGEQGVINCARPGALIVDMSTIGSVEARYLGEKLQAQGFRFLDAPVSGGDIGAQKGTLTIMVGGAEEDFQECLPYFQALGKTIKLCGSVGSGQAVKLCNQILCALNMVGLCEALEMAKLQGIDPNLVIEVCQTGAAGSWALANLGPKIVGRDLEPGFMIKHILKDLRIVQEMVDDQDNHLPGVELSDRLFKLVADLQGGREQGTQAMIRAYEEK
jgi:3-hydroxyisobutyrate dehydrogenase